MIWYTETLTVAQQPPTTTLKLVGYLQQNKPVPITIVLEYDDISLTLYEHAPSGRIEDPEASDILKYYRTKIAKIKARLANAKYSTLQDVKPL